MIYVFFMRFCIIWDSEIKIYWNCCEMLLCNICLFKMLMVFMKEFEVCDVNKFEIVFIYLYFIC